MEPGNSGHLVGVGRSGAYRHEATDAVADHRDRSCPDLEFGGPGVDRRLRGTAANASAWPSAVGMCGVLVGMTSPVVVEVSSLGQHDGGGARLRPQSVPRSEPAGFIVVGLGVAEQVHRRLVVGP